MRCSMLLTTIALLVFSAETRAQSQKEVDQIATTMVRLCVGGGKKTSVTGGGTAGVDLSLRSLDATGKVSGQFTISESSAEGLVNGLDNALSTVAADQADKVRECLGPVRKRLLDILVPLGKTELDAPAKKKLVLANKFCREGSFDEAKVVYSELITDYPNHPEISKDQDTCNSLASNPMEFKIILQVAPAVFVFGDSSPFLVSFTLSIDGDDCTKFSNLSGPYSDTCSVVPGTRPITFRHVHLYDANHNLLSNAGDCGATMKFSPAKPLLGAVLCFKAPYVKCTLLPIGDKYNNFATKDCPS
jgi:hypothetical protein